MLVPMGLLHAVSHLTVVLGLGAGAVSFLQTVKASEACFTALLSFLFLGQVRPRGFLGMSVEFLQVIFWGERGGVLDTMHGGVRRVLLDARFFLLLTIAELPGHFCLTLVPEFAAVREGSARYILGFRLLLWA